MRLWKFRCLPLEREKVWAWIEKLEPRTWKRKRETCKFLLNSVGSIRS